MIKHCIIKSKGDTIVCLVSEVEKPKQSDHEKLSSYLRALNNWYESRKEYPVKDAGKFELWCWENVVKKSNKQTQDHYSEGIYIPPSLIKIEKKVCHDNGNKFYIEYAVLVTQNEVKEESQKNILRDLLNNHLENGINDTLLKFIIHRK